LFSVNPRTKKFYTACNPCRAKRQSKQKASYPKHAQKRKAYSRQYYQEHKEEHRVYNREYMRRKLRESPVFRLECNLRTRLRHAVRETVKSARTVELIGCTIPELRAHLEKQFTDGMTWANYGKWHVDHIRPCKSFELSDPEQQRICFHYSNLQPLWAKDNHEKSGRWLEMVQYDMVMLELESLA
jgi:hypothetical protein